MHAGSTAEWRDVWEATSFQLERLQASEATVSQEQQGLASRYDLLAHQLLASVQMSPCRLHVCTMFVMASLDSVSYQQPSDVPSWHLASKQAGH